MARSRPDEPTLLFPTPKLRLREGCLVVSPGSDSERRIPFRGDPLIIGSRDGADVVVEDRHVSGRHAEVTLADEGLIVRDLESRNGTRLDGVKIQSAPLSHGARIMVGSTTILFLADAQPEAPAELPDDAPTMFGEAIGNGPAMRSVFSLLERIAPADLTVCVLGETGTGKDVLARAIHAASPRRNGPFVVLDCGAVAPTLIESELFGHARGAFTGAVADRPGVFERGNGGTVFLDEIGELAIDLQPKLLRVLEQGRVTRVGDSADIPIDVRMIAATNRDLEREVAERRFREDLFFRLCAAVVRLPALRERPEDLPELARTFAEVIRSGLKISPDAMAILAAHNWPGNVRELRNVIAGAAAVCKTDEITPKDFVLFHRRRREPTLERVPLAGRTLESIEKSAIKQTLDHFAGNKTRAAEALGIAPSTLYAKIKKYTL